MTTKGRGKSGRGNRAMTDDEAALWDYATRAVDPAKHKPRVRAARQDDAPAPPRRVALPSNPGADASRAKPATPLPSATPAEKRTPLAEFDRRKARQIASGKIEIGARLDLHGAYQRDARARLRAFLSEAYTRGHKTVLVITGKGTEKEPADGLGTLLGERQRGVLKRNVPLWLADPDLRAVVLSFTEASARHGGSGALYVQLRKRQSD